MIASLHLIRNPPGVASREWALALRHAGTLGATLARPLLLARLTTVPAPVPSLTSFAVLALWPSAGHLAAARERSPLLARWRSAPEWLELDLEPRRSHGAWRGENPLAGAGAGKPRDEDGPALVITYARLHPRHLPSFWRANPAAVRHLRDQPGVAWDSGWADRALGVVGTFSLWPAGRDATRFAYADGGHRAGLRASREGPWFTESWFARLRPVAAAGSWDGAVPLVGLRSA